MSKKRRGKKPLPSISGPFDEIVRKLQKNGIRSIRKSKWGLRPFLESNMHRELDDDVELRRGEWWVPVAFDGEHWIVHPCCPPEDIERLCPDAIAEWKKIAKGPTRQPKEDSDEDSVLNELFALEGWIQGQLAYAPESEGDDIKETQQPSRTEDKRIAPVRAGMEHATEALRLLRQAVEAVAEKSSLPRHDESPIEEHPLDLPAEIWKAIDLAYHAGRASERAGLHFRGVPEIARKGERMARRAGAGRPSKRPKTEDKLEGWNRRVVDLLRERPGIRSDEILVELEREKLAKKDGDRVIFMRDEVIPTENLDYGTFKQKVSSLRRIFAKGDRGPA